MGQLFSVGQTQDHKAQANGEVVFAITILPPEWADAARPLTLWIERSGMENRLPLSMDIALGRTGAREE